MPMLKITGIPKDEVIKESKVLIDELQEIIGCPRDYFTIELNNNEFIMDGAIVGAPNKIEVAWFDRGKELRGEVAKAITNRFKKHRECLDVIFYGLEKESYYENGEHF